MSLSTFVARSTQLKHEGLKAVVRTCCTVVVMLHLKGVNV